MFSVWLLSLLPFFLLLRRLHSSSITVVTFAFCPSCCLTFEGSVSLPTSLLVISCSLLSLAGCIIQYQQCVSSITSSMHITWIGVGMCTGEKLELEQLTSMRLLSILFPRETYSILRVSVRGSYCTRVYNREQLQESFERLGAKFEVVRQPNENCATANI